MTTLYLVRHGQTDWNRDGRYQGQADIPLNDRGREQAGVLAETFQQFKIKAVWASDLCRARETAAIIARSHNLCVHVHPGLREMHFGCWQGLSWQQAEQCFPQDWRRFVNNPRGYEIPGGETLSQLEARFEQAIAEICAGNPRGEVIVVAHGGPISLLLSRLTGREFWALQQENCAFSKLLYRRSRFKYVGTAKLPDSAAEPDWDEGNHESRSSKPG